MSSAPLVRWDQKIPNNYKREKNIIWWYSLEGILGEGSLAEHHGNFWGCPNWGLCQFMGEPVWTTGKKVRKLRLISIFMWTRANHYTSLGLSFLKHKLRGVLGGARWLNMISTPGFLLAWIRPYSETIVGSPSNLGHKSCFSLAPDQVLAVLMCY